MIEYRGPISAEGVARFRQALTRDIMALKITSSGGDEKLSLEMAELVRARGLHVFVEGYCMSACAQAILPAASRRVLLGSALVGLHHSAVSMLPLYAARGEEPPEDLEDKRARYQALYGRMGVDIEILSCAGERIGLIPRYVEASYAGAPARGWLSIRGEVWFPTDETLRRYGLTVERQGKAPPSKRAVQKLLKAEGFKPVPRFVFDEDC